MNFRNFYRCYRCGHEWQDVWSAIADDDCPRCGARHVSPYKTEDEEDGDEDPTLASSPTNCCTSKRPRTW
jgi:predicted  nucleic acid-binding Zn-ribbon protein